MEIIVILGTLTVLFWLGFHITGALFSAAIWLLIKLPIALLFGGLGMVLCVTILLIPVGLKCFKIALNILI